MRKQHVTLKSDSSESELELDLCKPQDVEKQSLDDSNTSIVSKGRGRPKIPLKWSRVISLSDDNLTNLKVFELAPDLLIGGAMSKSNTRNRKEKKWKPIFWPDEYITEGHNMTLEGNKLSELQLKKQAVVATKARKLFRDRAENIVGKAEGF